jgi:hypothetical protein
VCTIQQTIHHPIPAGVERSGSVGRLIRRFTDFVGNTHVRAGKQSNVQMPGPVPGGWLCGMLLQMTILWFQTTN